MADLNLPELVSLNDFGGDWEAYYEYTYECFQEDFVNNPLKMFQGKRINLKRHPLTDDKEATFYHLTHEGKDEQNREPDLSRMERLRWVKHMMANADNDELKVWRNRRGNDENIIIYHENEGYVVVLADRGDYVLPWTAYPVQYASRRRKLLAEYEAYIKAEAAKKT
ncbi:hypothetical protein [Pedobacter sp.]